MSSTPTPKPGDIVRVTYAALWAPEGGDPRMVLTGNDGYDRWHNIVPDNATVEILHRPGDDGQDEPEPGLCPQNLRGDKAVPQSHHYSPDGLRCVFCHAAAHWGGEPARALRTPDGRVWQLAAEKTEGRHALYEAPFVACRYTAMALEQLHADQGDVVVVAEPAPPYVFNARSVNRAPGTAVKHIPGPDGFTICPRRFKASTPMTQQEAARLPLCNGCRDTRLVSTYAPRPGCAGAAVDHDETGICTHA
ncbi:hypothetical protein ABZ682_22725 [Streptomyces griseoviridis]|uniref:hypothetical protein n=1 Tax=Streptomyces griseoviridis TaxID=45398 RepID=UPI0033E038B7